MLLGTVLFAALPSIARGEPPREERGVRVLASPEIEGLDFHPYRRKVALVIGIDDYRPGIPELRYAVRDARAVEDLLRNFLGFDEVITLENEHARRSDILRTIVDLRGKLQAEDQFFFFLAGHGVTFGEGDREMGYLVSQDTPGLDEASIAIGAISMADLRDQLVRLPAKHVLLVVDACYSGYAAVVARGTRQSARAGYLRAITENRARQILTAGKRGQSAFEKEDWGHSAFTYKLLQGVRERLADRDRDGIVTAVELHSYLHVAVTELTLGAQTPQFADLTHDEGEFAFLLPEIEEKEIVELSQPTYLQIFGDRVEVYDRLRHLLWEHTASGELAQGWIVDLQGDGAKEVVVSLGRSARDAGRVLAFDFRGDLLWSRDSGESPIYEGASSGRFVVAQLAAEDLLGGKQREIVVLWVDAQGWPASRVSILGSDGQLLSSYWHPGQLRDLAIVRATDGLPWRVLVGGLNNDLGRLDSGDGVPYGLFLLDPRDVKGEAPPYKGRLGSGSQLWYGVLSPQEVRTAELFARDVNDDGVREVVLRTAAGDEIYLTFDGILAGFRAASGRGTLALPTFLRLE